MQKSWEFGKSKTVAVLGSQWGDEGKGKLVDVLAAKADLVCRFNGGSNAGHTIILPGGEKVALHIVPSGIIRPTAKCFIGAGVVIHLEGIKRELASLERILPECSKQIFIDERAHITFDIHLHLDRLYEQERSGKDGNSDTEDASIGTTRKGIGPTYAHKALRLGVRAGALRCMAELEKQCCRVYDEAKKRFPALSNMCPYTELNENKSIIEKLSPQVVDGVTFMHNALKLKQHILIEGANGAMLDLNFGTYPHVTSSATVAGGISHGLGVPPSVVDYTLAVVKAYTTRVGFGVFPTELKGDIANHLVTNGGEFGATTGRERRVGWLDVPMLRYSNALSGYDGIALTKIDVLSGLDKVAICTDYENNETGECEGEVSWGHLVTEPNALLKRMPRYKYLQGWSEDLTNCTDYKELPQAVKDYVEEVQNLISVPIVMVGVGPGRHQLLHIS